MSIFDQYKRKLLVNPNYMVQEEICAKKQKAMENNYKCPILIQNI